MIRMIFVFLVVFATFFVGIKVLQNLSEKEKWALTKMLAYSTLCSVLTMLTLFTFVVLF